MCFRESLAQLIEAGKKVVDSPVHLADFGRFTLSERRLSSLSLSPSLSPRCCSDQCRLPSASSSNGVYKCMFPLLHDHLFHVSHCHMTFLDP